MGQTHSLCVRTTRASRRCGRVVLGNSVIKVNPSGVKHAEIHCGSEWYLQAEVAARSVWGWVFFSLLKFSGASKNKFLCVLIPNQESNPQSKAQHNAEHLFCCLAPAPAAVGCAALHCTELPPQLGWMWDMGTSAARQLLGMVLCQSDAPSP